jgi:hypothetical protein
LKESSADLIKEPSAENLSRTLSKSTFALYLGSAIAGMGRTVLGKKLKK